MNGITGLARWLFPCVVGLATFGVFFPALKNGFVSWDDPDTLLENQNFRGLTWSHLSWMFTTLHMGHYQPLSWFTFALDYMIWELDPLGYHITNLLFHSANAVLFYFVSVRLLHAATGSHYSHFALRLAGGLSALLFAIHPLRVESVAWATQRRDVLSAFFLLLTVLYYLKGVGSQVGTSTGRRSLTVAVILYGLSLLSKASGMTLPAVLLVLDVFPLRRLGGGVRKWIGRDVWRIWLEKIPFFVLALAAGASALAAQWQAGALVAADTHTVTGRLVQACYGIAFYLVKTFMPTQLAPLYELHSGVDPFDWLFVISAVVVIAVSFGTFLLRRRWPAALATWIVYMVVLAPTLGIAQSGLQIVADRYSYLAGMVLGLFLAFALTRCWQLCTEWIPHSVVAAVSTGFALLVLSGLATLTWRQTEVWRDSETLWRHALAASPSSMAHFNLGKLSLNRGDLDEASKHFRRAVELNPNNGVIQSNLGLVLAKQGNLTEATAHFRRALEINAADVAALNNMAIALAQQGRLDEAIAYLRRVLEIKPRDAVGHTNMANALLGRGDMEGAIEHLRSAIEIDPGDADNQSNLAIVLAKRGDLQEATKYLRRVVEIKAQDAGAHNNLAIALAKQGQLEEAVRHFQGALRIDPNLAEAHAGLARVLAMQNKPNEAMSHYQEAIKILKAQQKTARAESPDQK